MLIYIIVCMGIYLEFRAKNHMLSSIEYLPANVQMDSVLLQGRDFNPSS